MKITNDDLTYKTWIEFETKDLDILNDGKVIVEDHNGYMVTVSVKPPKRGIVQVRARVKGEEFSASGIDFQEAMKDLFEQVGDVRNETVEFKWREVFDITDDKPWNWEPEIQAGSADVEDEIAGLAPTRKEEARYDDAIKNLDEFDRINGGE